MEKALSRQLGKKQKALALNLAALKAGFDYAKRTLPDEGAVPRRADERDGRQDPDRGQFRGRDRLPHGGRHGRRLVSHHALVLAVRVADRPAAQVPDGQGDGAGHLRRRAGGRRDCRARHGHRRELGWRARDDVHVGPRHLVDGRVHRPRLLRRDPCGDFRHPARRALHRPSDADRAGRHPDDRGAVARRHAPPAAAAVLGARVLSDGHRRLRSGRAAADAGVHHVRTWISG